ncbi:hypothetical protein, partial [Streptococcus pyogenes]|uniref:hypothetical protein n=1 Tax=Streptococcus pyogenes TaxID=1314 RepID=UPI001652F214
EGKETEEGEREKGREEESTVGELMGREAFCRNQTSFAKRRGCSERKEKRKERRKGFQGKM